MSLLEGASLLKRLFHFCSGVIQSVAAKVCSFTDCFFDSDALSLHFCPRYGIRSIIFWGVTHNFLDSANFFYNTPCCKACNTVCGQKK